MAKDGAGTPLNETNNSIEKLALFDYEGEASKPIRDEAMRELVQGIK
ncbi:MAG: hypothetical protein NT157_01025 [Candidatus Micrarchaeota archaeon]|nr:hypothetical protein [Candidatus Micrarchaeota archaeon]